MKVLQKHTPIFGRTQSGKTYFFTDYLFGKILNHYGLMFDIKRDRTISKMIKKHNFKVTENPNNIDFNKSKKWVFRRAIHHEKNEYLDMVFKLIDYYFDTKPPIYFFIDEIGSYCSKHSLPNSLEKLIRMGLGLNKIMIWNTQRLQSTHNDLVTQSENFFIFDIHDYDYKHLIDYGILPDNEKSKKWIERDYHFIFYDGIDHHYINPI